MPLVLYSFLCFLCLSSDKFNYTPCIFCGDTRNMDLENGFCSVKFVVSSFSHPKICDIPVPKTLVYVIEILFVVFVDKRVNSRFGIQILSLKFEEENCVVYRLPSKK